MAQTLSDVAQNIISKLKEVAEETALETAEYVKEQAKQIANLDAREIAYSVYPGKYDNVS